jgi:hypothetical protein
VHATLLVIAMRAGDASTESSLELPAMATPSPFEITTVELIVDSPKGTAGSSGGGQVAPRRAPAARVSAPANPWDDLTVSAEDTDGQGQGHGAGTGTGTGIGFGDGGHVRTITSLPATPAPFVSKARPAKLLHPTRQTEVDDADLFEAKVTVDNTGDVVGAHMVRTHPGSHGEVASSMIWQFRYSPALDDDGAPVTSTFVQTFAVR